MLSDETRSHFAFSSYIFVSVNSLANLRDSIGTLENSDRTKWIMILIFACLSSVIDLVSILSLSAFISLTIFSPDVALTERIEAILGFFPFIGNLGNVWLIGMLTMLLLIARIFISISLTHKATRLLTNTAAELSKNALSLICKLPLLELRKRTTAQYIWLLGEGIQSTTVGVLSTSLVIISEVFLLLVIFLGLIVINPVVSFFLLVYFFVVILFLRFVINARLHRLQHKRSINHMDSNEIVIERIDSFREIQVMNMGSEYNSMFLDLRSKDAKQLTRLIVLSVLPRYVIEGSFYLGIAITVIFTTQFVSLDVSAFSISAMIAAGFRILPSIVRLQSALGNLAATLGASKEAFKLLNDLKLYSSSIQKISPFNLSQNCQTSFQANLLIDNVNFAYPDSTSFRIESLSLSVSPGEKIGITGPSGCGKSTVLDLILGFVQPQSGTIKLSGVEPRAVFEMWPRSIAYVAQSPGFANRSIAWNVAMTPNEEQINRKRIWEVLNDVGLSKFVESLPQRLDTILGERSFKLSGGQRQRLGLARALYWNPKFLILDEATSAIDRDSDTQIASLLEAMSDVTILSVAHRSTAIKWCSRIIYLEQGRVVNQGTWEETIFKFPFLEN